jgi:hypothetical protein
MVMLPVYEAPRICRVEKGKARERGSNGTGRRDRKKTITPAEAGVIADRIVVS